VSSGQLLRRSMGSGDPFGVRALIAEGRLVPDEIVDALLEPRLGDGFILDGYPRTAVQAERLDALLARLENPLDTAVELVLDEGTLVARMMLRADAEHRVDDRPSVFLRRLEDYRESIAALREHYAGRLLSVDGAGSEDEVFDRLRSALRV